MADNLDDVFGAGAMEDATVQEVSSEAEPTQAEAVTPEPQQEQPVEQPEPETPEQRQVPFGAMLDERDRRKAAEQERDELRRKLQEQEAGQQSGNVPDPFDQPEQYAQYQEQRFEQRLFEHKLEMSYQMAAQALGKETVDTAREWAIEKAKGDPAFDQMLKNELQRQPNPLDWVVQQHKRDALLSDIGDNTDDWFVREAAKRGYVMQSATGEASAEPAPKPASPQVKVPRSLANQGSIQSDVRQTASGPLAGVDALFG